MVQRSHSSVKEMLEPNWLGDRSITMAVCVVEETRFRRMEHLTWHV